MNFFNLAYGRFLPRVFATRRPLAVHIHGKLRHASMSLRVLWRRHLACSRSHREDISLPMSPLVRAIMPNPGIFYFTARTQGPVRKRVIAAPLGG